MPHDSPDPLQGKYHDISPYTYCNGNPISLIDPSGEDVVVLNKRTGMHLAMLVQGDDSKWHYYSVNGDNVYLGDKHIGGRKFDDLNVGAWNSPEEFFASDYNQEVEEERRNDKTVNFYAFEEGYRIKTTPQQDAIIADTFVEISEKEEYNLLTNNCAHAVQRSLYEAGVPVSIPKHTVVHIPANRYIGEDSFKIIISEPKYSIVPVVAFKSIIESNPNGKYIFK